MNKIVNDEKQYKFKFAKIYFIKDSNSKIIHKYNNYCIKEYSLDYINIELFINILSFLQTTKNLPKTIYKSYYFTENINLLKKYIIRTSLPNNFIIQNKNLFEQISSKDKLKQKIYELSKYNKVSFRDFIEELNSNQNISNKN